MEKMNLGSKDKDGSPLEKEKGLPVKLLGAQELEALGVKLGALDQVAITVAKKIVEALKDQYDFPGEEYLNDLIKNSDKIPESMRDKNKKYVWPGTLDVERYGACSYGRTRQEAVYFR
ncbi:MAG: hypothetical protein WC603_01835 [Candidatus Paceibacterota bacterium]|jgi:hypothetical protein